MFNNDKEVVKELENIKLIDSLNRIIRWPKKQSEKELVLEYISSKIEIGKKYTESEINGIIIQWQRFDDYALIRREMFDRNMIKRTKDCKEYWKDKET